VTQPTGQAKAKYAVLLFVAIRHVSNISRFQGGSIPIPRLRSHVHAAIPRIERSMRLTGRFASASIKLVSDHFPLNVFDHPRIVTCLVLTYGLAELPCDCHATFLWKKQERALLLSFDKKQIVSQIST